MKDSYWFRHDSNARNDPKMVALRRVHGWEGVGIFWALVELLREQQEYFISRDTLVDLAYDMRADDLPQIVDTCCDVGLLVCDDDMVSAPALSRNMEAWDKRRLSLAIAGRKGGLSRAQASTVHKSTEEENKKERAPSVLLTDEEYAKLVESYGTRQAQAAVDKLGKYKLSSSYDDKVAKGKGYKSDYRAILSWVVDALDLKKESRCPECKKLLPDVGTYCLACGWEKG